MQCNYAIHVLGMNKAPKCFSKMGTVGEEEKPLDTLWRTVEEMRATKCTWTELSWFVHECDGCWILISSPCCS